MLDTEGLMLTSIGFVQVLVTVIVISLLVPVAGEAQTSLLGVIITLMTSLLARALSEYWLPLVPTLLLFFFHW